MCYLVRQNVIHVCCWSYDTRSKVGEAAWAPDLKEQEEHDDLLVVVSIDGARQIHHTMSAKTAHCWDQDLKMCVLS